MAENFDGGLPVSRRAALATLFLIPPGAAACEQQSNADLDDRRLSGTRTRPTGNPRGNFAPTSQTGGGDGGY